MSAPQEIQPDLKLIAAFLAKGSQVPLEDIAKLYEHEHAKLATGAHITKFLHIFAIRKVQEILRKRGIEQLAKPAAGRPLLPPQRRRMPLRPTWSAAPALAETSPPP